jgi:hypothetical protein
MDCSQLRRRRHVKVERTSPFHLLASSLQGGFGWQSFALLIYARRLFGLSKP